MVYCNIAAWMSSRSPICIRGALALSIFLQAKERMVVMDTNIDFTSCSAVLLVERNNQFFHFTSYSTSLLETTHTQGTSSSLSSPKLKLKPPPFVSPSSFPTAASHFLFLPSAFFSSSASASSSSSGCSTCIRSINNP